MIDQNFYSIRMHASALGLHISGAERIVSAEKTDRTVSELIGRAKSKECRPDRITVAIESVGTMPRALKALDVVTLDVSETSRARLVVTDILSHLDVADSAIAQAMHWLSNGAAPSGDNMRGALIMDASTGERLEPDQTRGVRASRFDWSEEEGTLIRKKLAEQGLSHFRTSEALALASKIAHGPGVIAELCWSDDPDYTAGYVASLRTGYVRFPFLKPLGSKKGGRTVFVDPRSADIPSLIRYLETEAVLISEAGICNPAKDPGSFLAGLA